MRRLRVYVQGYGTPQDPLTDGNLGRYLGEVVDYVREHAGTYDQVILVLAGGCTNRDDLSEAAAMEQWLRHQELPEGTQIQKIELGPLASAREYLGEFKRQYGNGIHPVIFCEYSRRFYMFYFATKLFPIFGVRGVKFDAKSLERGRKWRTYLVQTPLEVGAWHSFWLNLLRLRRREQLLARVRS